MRKKIKEGIGRPSTLTQEIADIIINNVREDLSVRFAANRAGINESTIRSWVEHGKKDISAGIETIQAYFSRGIEKARAEFVHESVVFLKEDKAWQAKTWLLERCCPEEFGRDSELYRQLLDDYKMLMQSIIDNNSGVNNGNKTSNPETI